VTPLGKAAAEGDAETRLAAVQALAEIGSPSALQLLERAVEDTDRDVRVSTLRAIGARAYRPALPRLEAAARGKALRAADLTEKMAFFETYGSLCGEGGVEYLDELLNGKGFLGRREDPELRACAAMALGRIGGQRATESLRRAAGDEKEVLVRNAVNRALRGGAT
jgi:HEAT repeat protein